MRNFFKHNEEILYVTLITLVLSCMGLSRMNEVIPIYEEIFEALDDFTFLVLVLVCWGKTDQNDVRLQRVLGTFILLSSFNFIDSLFNFKEGTYVTVLATLLFLNFLYIVIINFVLPRWKK